VGIDLSFGEGMMTNVATFTNNDEFCDEDMRCLAYVVLPNGEYWNVRFNGATAEIARSKAIALWNKENEKWDKLGLSAQADDEALESKPLDPWATSAKGKHFVGTVWMRHSVDGLKRVALTEITMYEKNGYYRSGPRSK
jgi:hypothetical protein